MRNLRVNSAAVKAVSGRFGNAVFGIGAVNRPFGAVVFAPFNRPVVGAVSESGAISGRFWAVNNRNREYSPGKRQSPTNRGVSTFRGGAVSNRPPFSVNWAFGVRFSVNRAETARETVNRAVGGENNRPVSAAVNRTETAPVNRSETAARGRKAISANRPFNRVGGVS